MTSPWEVRFKRIRFLGWLILIGLPFIALAEFTAGFLRDFAISSALFLILPGAIYIYAIVILHWKARYRGRHSDLWGVLILVETSGWMKLVYLFRHIIPDMRHSGRYRLPPDEPPIHQVSSQ
jgi:hypothetical protein